jgi:hypothetical protein
MLADAPALLIAIEQSSFALGIRQSVWAYPAANVGHILALFLLAGAVCVMDLALLGVVRAANPVAVVRGARRAAIVALLLMLATGSILFAAEASHVAMNPVFQIKLGLITFGILNAALIGPLLRRTLDEVPPPVAFPLRVRTAAAMSLMIWLSVAACGRLIAYF